MLTADVDHRQATYARPALVLMGNEQQGLTPDMAALCDVNVKIPMRGRADSLNLSVATGPLPRRQEPQVARGLARAVGAVLAGSSGQTCLG